MCHRTARTAVSPNRLYHARIVELLPDPIETGVPCEHLVQVYRDRFDLAESVATYLGAGFESGEPGVVIATAAHWPVMSERLERRGWNAAELERDGRLVVVDAETTLAAFTEDGRFSYRKFSEIVGELIERVASTGRGRRVRAFGEMVDLLVRRGDAAAADELERMWNRLATRFDFTLLCGYKIDVFDRHAQVALLPQVYRSHSHVLPRIDEAALERAIDSALREVLGETDAQKLYAQAAKHPGNGQVPTAQRTLMWASSHMPRTAEEILAKTRANYLRAAEPSA